MNFEKKFKSELVVIVTPFVISFAKKVSYAIAIPTINNKIANNALNPELSILSPKFSDNVLKASNKINKYWINDQKKLDGIPQSFIDASSELAKKEGREKGWCFSLDTNFGIIMKFCKDRSIRKEVLHLMGSRCNGGEFDNTNILKKISRLRHERANLMGYYTHAYYVLIRRMAK